MMHRFLTLIAGVVVAIAVPAQPLLAQNQTAEPQFEAPAEPQPEAASNDGLLEWMQSFAASLNEPKPLDTSKPVVGFGISSNESGMKIDVVLPGSAAEKAGLKVGMVILRINGITMKTFETAEVVKILGAIEGEINFDIEGQGRFSLIKAAIPATGNGS